MTSKVKTKLSLTTSKTWRRIRRNRGMQVGSVIVTGFIITAILAPWIAPYNPYAVNPDRLLEFPSPEYVLGTDHLGRDVFSRVVYGAQISLVIGILVTAIALVAGMTLGIASGYIGGQVDNIIMRICDILLAFPGILLALAIISALGLGLYNVMIAVGVWSIPVFTRVIRSAILTVKEEVYVLAAKGIGETDMSIVLRYILPNCISPIIVQTTLRIGTVILVSASLSFLGLGVQPPTAEWGVMCSEARQFLQVAPHLATFPGLAILFVVVGFNLFGDGLRDVLDVRLKD